MSEELGMFALPSMEEATIRAFIIAERRPRYLEQMASPKRRNLFLGRLNHCRDFDARFVLPVPKDSPLLSSLRVRGAPKECHIISSDERIDGLDFPLKDAVEAVNESGWGTIICCVPGRLAYFRDELEQGPCREFILERAR